MYKESSEEDVNTFHANTLVINQENELIKRMNSSREWIHQQNDLEQRNFYSILIYMRRSTVCSDGIYSNFILGNDGLSLSWDTLVRCLK